MLHSYLLSVSVPTDPLWERQHGETKRTVGFNMQISPEHAQFMSFLIRLMGKKALEIGTFTGFDEGVNSTLIPIGDGFYLAHKL